MRGFFGPFLRFAWIAAAALCASADRRRRPSDFVRLALGVCLNSIGVSPHFREASLDLLIGLRTELFDLLVGPRTEPFDLLVEGLRELGDVVRYGGVAVLLAGSSGPVSAGFRAPSSSASSFSTRERNVTTSNSTSRGTSRPGPDRSPSLFGEGR